MVLLLESPTLQIVTLLRVPPHRPASAPTAFSRSRGGLLALVRRSRGAQGSHPRAEQTHEAVEGSTPGCLKERKLEGKWINVLEHGALPVGWGPPSSTLPQGHAEERKKMQVRYLGWS